MIQRTYSELNMDMLVFENRNQSYGAFEIRRVYNSHIRNSLLIAIFFSAGLFGGLYLINKNISASTIASIKPDIDVLIHPGKLEIMTYHPEAAKPVLQTITPVAPLENTNYKPVDEPVTEIVPIANNSTAIPDGSQVLTGIGGTDGIGEGIQETVSPTTIETIDEAVDFVEVMPKFGNTDGDLKKFLIDNIHYPGRMINQSISGKVYVSFVIEKDGSIGMIQLVKGVADELDAEAIRVISKMPSWKPGMQNGKPVRVKRIVPIVFSLN